MKMAAATSGSGLANIPGLATVLAGNDRALRQMSTYRAVMKYRKDSKERRRIHKELLQVAKLLPVIKRHKQLPTVTMSGKEYRLFIMQQKQNLHMLESIEDDKQYSYIPVDVETITAQQYFPLLKKAYRSYGKSGVKMLYQKVMQERCRCAIYQPGFYHLQDEKNFADYLEQEPEINETHCRLFLKAFDSLFDYTMLTIKMDV